MLCGGEKMEQKLRRDRDLGDNLRRLRNASGLSQEKLCAELQRRGCDIGRTTYAKYKAGELNVRVSVLLALKRLYDCPYDAFFAGLDTADDAEARSQSAAPEADRFRGHPSCTNQNQKSALPTVRGCSSTSRMLLTPVRYMTMRSKPRPKPAWRALA